MCTLHQIVAYVVGESDVSPKSEPAVQLPDTLAVFQDVIKSPSSSWLQNTCAEGTDPDELCLCEVSQCFVT